MNMRRNRGFLLVTAIVILVILSIVAAVLADLSMSNDQASVQDVRGAQALSIADAGLNEASLGLLSPTVYDTASAENRQSCASIATNLTNAAVGAGVFSVTGVMYGSSAATLSGALAAPTTAAPTPVIPFTGSSAGYAPRGRIMVDSEEIDYSAISQNSATCGAAGVSCFVGVIRGVDGTTAVAHASGTPIAQYQCTVASQGGVPTVAAPKALRTVKAAFQLQGGWAVGSEVVGKGSTQPYLLQWQSDAWAPWTPAAVPTDSLNAVTCTNYADCWAVGSAQVATLVANVNCHTNKGKGAGGGTCNTKGGGGGGGTTAPVAVALHWNGQTWTSEGLPAAVTGHDLDGVACPAFDDCWMVGSFTQTGTNRWTLLHWNGAFTSITPNQVLSAPGSTTTLSAATYDQYDIDSVACVSADQCWAVGSLGLSYANVQNGRSAVTLVLEYNGTQWARVAPASLPTQDDLDAITCLAQGCWAVGGFAQKAPVAAYWDAATNTWTTYPSTAFPGGGDLESITCVTVNDCWAGGSWSSGGPTLEHWNGTTWTSATASSGATSDIDGMGCLNADDCWAVGGLGGAQLLHWDGSAWANLSADVANFQNLEAIDLIGAHGAAESAWREVFP